MPSSQSAVDHPAPDGGVYGIAVAAELTKSAPQNLRLYEAGGLLTPAGRDGGTRRYSEDDLQRIREIGRLLDVGLNLAGIAMVLTLSDDNHALRSRLLAERQRQPEDTSPPLLTRRSGKDRNG